METEQGNRHLYKKYLLHPHYGSAAALGSRDSMVHKWAKKEFKKKKNSCPHEADILVVETRKDVN